MNKIKGMITGQTSNDDTGNMIYPGKSKVIPTLQSKVPQVPPPSLKQDSRQTDKLIKKEQFQYLLQKKARSPDDHRNYIPDFEEE